jgi:hypothetical protein
MLLLLCFAQLRLVIYPVDKCDLFGLFSGPGWTWDDLQVAEMFLLVLWNAIGSTQEVSFPGSLIYSNTP